jgi:hypothetical protein
MLSAEALALFRQFIERNSHLPVDDSNREAYRELAREGLMVPGHSFACGRESLYALSDAGKRFAVVVERNLGEKRGHAMRS